MLIQHAVMERRSAVRISPVPFGTILQQELYKPNVTNLHGTTTDTKQVPHLVSEQVRIVAGTEMSIGFMTSLHL